MQFKRAHDEAPGHRSELNRTAARDQHRKLQLLEASGLAVRYGLAWLLAQRAYIVPIPGTTKLHRLEENLAAADIRLTEDDLAEINSAASGMQAKGDRYSPQHLAMVGRDAPPANAGA